MYNLCPATATASLLLLLFFFLFVLLLSYPTFDIPEQGVVHGPRTGERGQPLDFHRDRASGIREAIPRVASSQWNHTALSMHQSTTTHAPSSPVIRRALSATPLSHLFPVGTAESPCDWTSENKDHPAVQPNHRIRNPTSPSHGSTIHAAH